MLTTLLLIYAGLGVLTAGALVSACVLSGLINTGRIHAGTARNHDKIPTRDFGLTRM